MSNFFDFFTTIGHPNEEFLKQLNSVFQKKEFKKNTIFHEGPNPCEYVYFIEKGCAIVYVENDNENKMVRDIYTPCMWLTDMDSLLNQSCSNETFMVISNQLITYRIHYSNFNLLRINNQRFADFTLKIAAKTQDNINQKNLATYNSTAIEKLQWFLLQARFKEQKIAKRYIAEYLNIRPETMSRLKNSKNLTPVNFNHIPGMYFC